MSRQALLIAGAVALAALAASSARAPRGIRNNNPGNMKDLGIPWRGMIGRDRDGFAVFERPEDGLRAMYIDLRTGFERDGENTVEKIIAEWSPDAQRAAYTKFVAGRLGVWPRQPLELRAVAPDLLEAITLFENGQNPYPRQLVELAIQAA